MIFIARELREIMGKLGIRTVEELVGRNDLIKIRDDLSDREKKLDLKRILLNVPCEKISHEEKDLFDFKLNTVIVESVL